MMKAGWSGRRSAYLPVYIAPPHDLMRPAEEALPELRAAGYRSMCLLANYSNIVGRSGCVLKAALLMHKNFRLIPANS
jgi:hypothetical protein